MRTLAVIATVLGLAVAPAAAQARGTHRHHHMLVPATTFLPKAASGNEFEILTGQLAQQRAQSSAVRDLGAMFVTDHTARLAQGTQVADQLGVAATPKLSRRQQAVAARLQTLSGGAFDAAWLRTQLKAHEQALRLNLATAIRGDDEAIRALGQGALPVITKHLGELIDLAEASR